MIFKFFKVSILSLLLSVSYYSFAQKDVQGKAFYESKASIDMENFGRPDMSEERKQEIVSRMRSVLEKTYVLTFNREESIYKEEEKETTSSNEGRGSRFRAMMSSFAPGIQYKNVKEELFLQDQEFFGKQFLIKDDLPKLEWKMAKETKQIGKYMCFKATATKTLGTTIDPTSFRRPRGDEQEAEEKDDKPKKIEVVAWYTMEIPVSQGPEEYWGLPGLILEIHAGKNTLLCSKIVLNTENKEEIIIPSKGKKVTKAQYDKIAAKKVEELQANFRNRTGNRGGGGAGGRR